MYTCSLAHQVMAMSSKSVIINHLKLIHIANRSERRKKSTAKFPLEKDQKVSFCLLKGTSY